MDKILNGAMRFIIMSMGFNMVAELVVWHVSKIVNFSLNANGWRQVEEVKQETDAPYFIHEKERYNDPPYFTNDVEQEDNSEETEERTHPYFDDIVEQGCDIRVGYARKEDIALFGFNVHDQLDFYINTVGTHDAAGTHHTSKQREIRDALQAPTAGR